MSIDAGDRWVEYEIEERERVGRYMYEHQYDYVDRSRYERVEKQLTKAKEIIKYLCGMVRELNKPNVQLTDVDYSLSEAEQFVSKVENV